MAGRRCTGAVSCGKTMPSVISAAPAVGMARVQAQVNQWLVYRSNSPPRPTAAVAQNSAKARPAASLRRSQ